MKARYFLEELTVAKNTEVSLVEKVGVEGTALVEGDASLGGKRKRASCNVATNTRGLTGRDGLG